MQKGVVRKRKTQALSEYGRQLKEKQTLRNEYNLREHAFRAYVQKTLQGARLKGSAPEMFMRLLETRLDNLVYRAGFAATRAKARQMVSHGHFLVNEKPMNIPSYGVRANDRVAVKNSSLASPLFADIQNIWKKFQAPVWIELDKEHTAVKVLSLPAMHEVEIGADIPLIFDFYSR
ncbi:MAG: 30S ribosomal protein S4 [Candidatus Wildermuthbacteria bacterium]|nr:30S ribosomal protein S4 [Candidatus Wildermuthbacteria bacterium]MBI2121084.1 30S ribosomal protein S4 [Candidatus Wildermuthbacteria bacterium]MBI2647965.1 30S ribosomal protein S4 [Candidatus Wildermuthbacteria bacterium]